MARHLPYPLSVISMNFSEPRSSTVICPWVYRRCALDCPRAYCDLSAAALSNAILGARGARQGGMACPDSPSYREGDPPPVLESQLGFPCATFITHTYSPYRIRQTDVHRSSFVGSFEGPCLEWSSTYFAGRLFPLPPSHPTSNPKLPRSSSSSSPIRRLSSTTPSFVVVD